MTPLSFDLLRRLADGEFHSGAALARALGVSRGTVWNAVRAVETAGAVVYKVRGRGYRLAERISLLDGDAIARAAQPVTSRLAIELVDDIESTNTVLMARARDGAPSGTVLAAELQRHGRGRMGRPWHAALGGAVTFSVLWRYDHGAHALSGLSLASGVALVRAAARLGTHEARLKWPNDVLWRGRKLAGMLIEMQGDALGPSAVVIGIGINVRLSAAVKRRIDQPAADLETACARALDRNAVLGTVLAELVPVLDRFGEDGFEALREEWQRHHAYQGESVTIRLPTGQTRPGIAIGVGEDGALLLRTGSAVRRLHSGEVSVSAALPHARARRGTARRRSGA